MASRPVPSAAAMANQIPPIAGDFPDLTVQVQLATLNQQTGQMRDVSTENDAFPAPLGILSTPDAVRDFQIQHFSATYARYGLSADLALGAQAYIWDMRAQRLLATDIGTNDVEWAAIVQRVAIRYRSLEVVKRANPNVGKILRPKIFVLFDERHFRAALTSRNVDPNGTISLIPVYNHELAVRLWQAGTPGLYGKGYQEYLALFGITLPANPTGG